MTRTNWVLAGLLALQIALIAILWGHAPATGETKPLVPGFDPAKVSRIEIGTKPDAKVVLSRRGGSWEIESAGGYPADTTRVAATLARIRDIKAGAPVVTSNRYHESLDITDEKARGRVVLFAEGSTKPLADLVVGSAVSSGSHVRLAGKGDVYEAKAISYQDYDPNASSWMVRTLAATPESEITSISITNANGSFSIAKSGQKWTVTSPAELGGKTVKKEKAEELARMLASINGDAPAGKVDDAAQGFAAPAAVATISAGGTQLTLRIGGHPPDNAGKVYLAKDGFPFAVTVWESSYSAVLKANVQEIVE